jgi:hypothetical protein
MRNISAPQRSQITASFDGLGVGHGLAEGAAGLSGSGMAVIIGWTWRIGTVRRNVCEGASDGRSG